jgi:hypothetical protein
MPYSRRHFLRLGTAGAAALSSLSWEPPLGRPDAGWTSGPPLPVPAQEVYCATWQGQIVVAGGLRSGPLHSRRFVPLDHTALFDPATGGWRTGPSLPAPRHHLALAAAQDRVYGFGGFVGEELGRNAFQFRPDVFAFDGDRWARVGRLPRPLGETVSLTTQGRVHLITGSLHGNTAAEQGPSGAHLVYDPAADAWDTAAPAPTARSSATGAVIDDHLYVAGGRQRTGDGIRNLGTLERYDPAADAWTPLRPLPQPSGGLAGAALNGTLYVFGGEFFSDGGGVYPHTWAYVPSADTWAERAPLPTPRHGLAGTALNGRVYAIGGNTAPALGAATADVVEVLSPADD